MTLMAFATVTASIDMMTAPLFSGAADWMAKQARADGAVTGECDTDLQHLH